MMKGMDGRLETWLLAFRLDQSLHGHAFTVLAALPATVQEDFITDPRFTIADYEPGPGVIMEVPVGAPAFNSASRSVMLKRTLRRSSHEFTRYVIAHELAHAHLRNQGRSPSEDPEHAADSLAALWGFPRPKNW